jgi:hypothetical protein
LTWRGVGHGSNVRNTTCGGRRTRCARGGFQGRSLIASLSACSALALGAGCGGAQPSGIRADTAAALARQSDGIAAALERGDRCEAAVLADALVTASRGARMPRAYRSPLLQVAHSLAERINCPPPPPPKHEKPEKHEEHEQHGEHEHGKKHDG